MANEIMVQNETAMAASIDFDIPEGYICTFDLDDYDAAMMFGAARGTAKSLKDMTNVPIAVRDVVTVPSVRASDGKDCIGTYLICDDGSAYFSQSNGIAESVRVLVRLSTNRVTGKFNAPCDRGWNWMVVEGTASNGNTYKNVIPVKA